MFSSFWNSLSGNGRGAIFILLAGFCFTAQGAGIKSLGNDLTFIQIAFIRSALAAIFVLPFALRQGGVRTERIGGHFLRGLLGIMAMSGMIFALTHARLADVTTMSFTRTLFAVLLATLILRETVGWRRWSAVLAGFLGVVVMMRPGAEGFNPYLLSALGAAFSGACVIMVVKTLGKTEPATRIVFYFGAFGTLLAAPGALWFWNWPSLEQWVLLLALSAIGTAGQTLMVRGWSSGEASAVAPFTYAQIIYAAGFGFFIFGEVLDIWTLVGAGIIVASTLYIARREARQRRAHAVEKSDPAM